MDFKLFSLLLVVTTTGRAFADLPDTLHSCAVQNDTFLTFEFTIPVGEGIHRVIIDFEFNGLSGSLAASQFTIDPYNETTPVALYAPFVCPGFYSTGSPTQQNIYPTSPTYGYLIRLRDNGSNQFRLEILNKPEVSGIWDGASDETWSVTISNIGGGTPDDYEFSLTTIIGDNNNTNDDDGDLVEFNSATDCILPTPTDLWFTSVSPCNQAPTVDSITSTLSTIAPLEVSFEAVNPQDDGTYDLIWHFGDSQTGSSNPVSHTYDSDGEYTVTLQLVDNYGALSDANPETPEDEPVAIVINTNQRPTLEGINATPNPANRLEVEFSADTPADPDAGDTIASYVWDFGNASVETHPDNSSFTHTYTAEDIYNVSLFVVDDKGLPSLAQYKLIDLSDATAVTAPTVNEPIKLYPTVSRSYFTIEMKSDYKYELYITDISGRVMETTALEPVTHIGSGLLPGVYYVFVQEPKQHAIVFCSKIIKL
jgi:PKD repeat protein